MASGESKLPGTAHMVTHESGPTSFQSSPLPTNPSTHPHTLSPTLGPHAPIPSGWLPRCPSTQSPLSHSTCSEEPLRCHHWIWCQLSLQLTSPQRVVLSSRTPRSNRCLFNFCDSSLTHTIMVGGYQSITEQKPEPLGCSCPHKGEGLGWGAQGWWGWGSYG